MFNLSTFVGSDRPDIDDSRRYFIDLYTVIKPTKKLELTWTVDLGREDFIIHGTQGYGMHEWLGTSLVLKLNTSKRTSWSARGEYYDVPASNTVISMAYLNSINPFSVAGYSLGYNRNLGQNLLWRVEGKGYVASTDLFRRAMPPLMTTMYSLHL